jgi:short-subunit dehydrogenase
VFVGVSHWFQEPMAYALITGASGGIGYELAKLFAQDKINLVLVARSREKLDAFASELQQKHSITAKVFAADLTQSSASVELFEFTKRESIGIDYLVNNAGFGIRRAFSETETEQILEMIDLNVTSLTHLTRLYLPQMLNQKSGKILNVASTAAFQPGPWMAVYYATKAYVLSFSEALSNELNKTGVTVTALCPGPTPTGFQQRAGAQNMQLMKSKILPALDAETVAKRGYEGMMRGKRVVIPGFMNRILALGARVGPRDWSTAIAGSMNKSKT